MGLLRHGGQFQWSMRWIEQRRCVEDITYLASARLVDEEATLALCMLLEEYQEGTM